MICLFLVLSCYFSVGLLGLLLKKKGKIEVSLMLGVGNNKAKRGEKRKKEKNQKAEKTFFKKELTKERVCDIIFELSQRETLKAKENCERKEVL